MNRYLQELLDSGSLPVIFDYDGVLFEARWYRTRINMPDETEEKLFSAMERGENLYTSPIPFMMELVPAIRSDIFVLSQSPNIIPLFRRNTFFGRIPQSRKRSICKKFWKRMGGSFTLTTRIRIW